MIDKEKVRAAVKEMTANPDWEEVLLDAPGGAQLRIELAFYASKNLDSMNQQEKDEYREFREMLESQLNAEELKYLTEAFGRMGVEAAQSHYQELFSKKTPEEQQQGTQAYEQRMKEMRGGGEEEPADGQEGAEEDGEEEASPEGSDLNDGGSRGEGESVSGEPREDGAEERETDAASDDDNHSEEQGE